jgi:hypothetical protein
MERAQALEDGAGLLERNRLGDEVDEVDLLFDGFGGTDGRGRISWMGADRGRRAACARRMRSA